MFGHTYLYSIVKIGIIGKLLDECRPHLVDEKVLELLLVEDAACGA